MVFNNGAGLRLVAAMDRSVANTLPTAPITVLEIFNTNFPATYNDVPLNPAGATVRQVSTAAATFASLSRPIRGG